MPTDESLVRLTGDNIIELIRERRSDLINKLLHDDELNLYLKETFDLSEEVSQIKREFIKRALKELNSVPIFRWIAVTIIFIKVVLKQNIILAIRWRSSTDQKRIQQPPSQHLLP
jgi:hypothetical protein